MKKRDIAVILMDQLSAKWYECASELGYTPNIDKIKAKSTYFTKCYTSSPMCVPARVSMFTGLHPRQHGCWWAGYTLNENLRTYMNILKDDGYRTAGIGKFHIAPEHMLSRPDYTKYGFDYSVETEDWEKCYPFGFINNNDPSSDSGFFYTLEDKEKTQTEFITRAAENYFDMMDDGDRLCTMISYVQPHPPITPPREYLDRVDKDKLPKMIKPKWRNDEGAPYDAFSQRAGDHPYNHQGSLRRQDPEEFWAQARVHYFADIIHLDEQVGRIISKLDERNGWENTDIIITADHGEMLGDHDMNGKLGIHYDACVRVPLIVHAQDTSSDTCESLIQHEDIFYTVLDMAGLSEKWYDYGQTSLVRHASRNAGSYYRTMKVNEPLKIAGMPGSVIPFCKGETNDMWRDAAIIESVDSKDNPYGHWARTVIKGDYRYTYFPGLRKEQLFNIIHNPDETENLAADPKYADKMQEMRVELIERSTWTEYPLPTRDMSARDLV
jgi:choline-sulfatase